MEGQRMKNYFAKEDGQGLVEYGLIISLVAIVSVSSLGLLSGGLGDKYDAFANVLGTEQQADGSYVITTEDGVYILSADGRLKGPYTGKEKEIRIPSSMNGFALKEIYQDVFKGKNLAEVVFDAGSGLVRIHARAFQDNDLKSVTLPEGLQRIDLWAFKDNNLTEITLPSSVKTLEQKAFDGNNITRVTIGSNVGSIGDNVFSNNTEGFKTAYQKGGAGTYAYVGGKWVKQ
jgi:Flp pilus assembly pilin Flp